MKVISALLKYSRSSVILAILCGILSGLAGIGILALINMLLSRGDQPIENRLLWAFVALCALAPVSRFVSACMLLRVSLRAVLDLRIDLSKKILNAPLPQLEALGPHRLLAILVRDTVSMATALRELPPMCVNFAVAVGSLAYLGWLSRPALLSMLVFMVVGFSVSRLPIIVGARCQRLVREQEDVLQRHFRAITDGTKELKLHQRRRQAFLGHFRNTARSFRGLNVAALSSFAAAAGLTQIMFFLTIGLILIVVPTRIDVEPEVLTGFAIVVIYLMIPVQFILNRLPVFTNAGVSLRNIENLGLSLTEEPCDGEEPAAATRQEDWQVLRLAGVTYTYRRQEKDGDFTLGPIDLDLHRGETILLAGGNGSGKTTLVKILIGLYEPEEGVISVDGATVGDEDRERYRQRFSAIFSDFFLFKELLGLDRPELDTRARELLVKLQLDHKVEVTNAELSTTRLSQGQRKRLALLTAFLEDRPIYLFDEWAADQDPNYKEVFYHQVLAGLKARGKTVVVVSHDDRYYDVADRIVKLEDGRIVRGQEQAG